MFDLKGKTALVTGAARRIGHAICVGLAMEGANIIIHYSKSESEAQKLKDEMSQLGVKSWLARVDFNDSKSANKLIAQAYEMSGRIDILINNASFFSASNVDNVKLEDIDSNMLVNAWTPFLLSRSFARKADHGKIINLLDTRITGYDFSHFAYYLSKKMLEVLTKSTALKLAPNITVNAVAPGLILPPEGKDYDYLERKKNAVPLNKYGSVSDVVDAALFLLKSEYITGQIIYVDGGVHLMQTLEGLSQFEKSK